MNWEKLKSPNRARFANLNFQSLYEMGKTWKCSPIFKDSKEPILSL